ncbi:hypothetical protein L1987_38862 [Smallanthus sonchifolius]|uniref:Uncharacterized protein n=1 Tax=Smallanthus sonchifolius TaxID=185202 RepID=A0ACB9HMX1_9ASTR|nr:hypothetical protein L1987_38862 [Smallanthus sonchifolius]
MIVRNTLITFYPHRLAPGQAASCRFPSGAQEPSETEVYYSYALKPLNVCVRALKPVLRYVMPMEHGDLDSKGVLASQ